MSASYLSPQAQDGLLRCKIVVPIVLYSHPKSLVLWSEEAVMIKVRVGGEHGVPHPPTQDVAGFLPFYGMTSTTSSLEYIPRNGRHNQFWYPCSPEYTPRNGRYNQLWYPGTQEYHPGMTEKNSFGTRVAQSIHPGMTNITSFGTRVPRVSSRV